MPPALTHVQSLLPDLGLVPIEEALRELRWMKTAEELNRIRRVADLAVLGTTKIPEKHAWRRFVQEFDPCDCRPRVSR